MLWFIASVTLPDSWKEKDVYLGNNPNQFPAYKALAKAIMQEMKGRRVIIRTLKANSDIKFWFKCGRRKFNIIPPTIFEEVFAKGREGMKHP